MHPPYKLLLSLLLLVASLSLVACSFLRTSPAQVDAAEQTSDTEAISLHIEEQSGAISYMWKRPEPRTVGSLGSIVARISLHGHTTTFHFQPILRAPGLPVHFVRYERANSSNQRTLVFFVGKQALHLTIGLRQMKAFLLIDVQADKALLSALQISLTSSDSTIRIADVPYYSAPLFYSPHAALFVDAYYDWQRSNATRLSSDEASYEPLTGGERNPLRETFVIGISEHLADVLPVINNPKSPYLPQLAGRAVIDVWNQSNFSQITYALNSLGEAGVRDCVVLIHGWQHNGYDNALPDTYPADTTQGGTASLATAIKAGRAIGCYVGVHENYSDYYPNFSRFTDSAVALNSDGSRMLSWLNTSRHIQSFATKQTRVLAHAAAESPKIHGGLNTNASFLDVISAATPWFHTDMDSTQRDAGMFSSVANTNKSLWNYERQTHGGPVFGEGLNHWYWTGLLDGVEAQFGAGNLNSLAEHNPLFVDFDLLRIHPLQVNHGMGMYERWATAGEDISQTNLMDAYRMQEVIYGHAPYVGGNLWNNVDRVLQEQNLVSPVARRYGTQPVKSILYQVNGTWTDTTAAINANDWSRVTVLYSNGDSIVANAQTQPLNLGTLQIPQYGWAAQGDKLLAYTALVNGVIADYSQTPTSYFANARNQSDLAQSGSIARPLVKSFTQTGVRSAAYQVRWQVLDGAQGARFNDFLHLVDGSGNIVVQGDYNLAIPTMKWKPGQTVTNNLQLSIPSTLADGTYSMRIGLYSAATGLRVQCQGVDDGSRRYILGNVVVANDGQSVTFQPQATPALPPDARMNAAGTVVDFSTIRTDGMVSLNLNAGAWTLQSYPRYRNVVAQLNTAQFPLPASISCDSVAVPVPAPVNGYWQLPTGGARACYWLTKPGGR
jgi:hypothetical protein